MGALEKEAKNKDKAQAKVDRERAKLAQIEKDRNEAEKRLNGTKALDDLTEQESALKGQNEEDQAIIQDDNTSPSEREAAEARVAERNGSSLVCELRLRKEKLACLSEKGSARSSKNMV